MDDRGTTPALERFQGYLRLVAGAHLHPLVQRKLDPSDVVQQTLLQAVQRWDQFRGQSDAELAAWLRTILMRTLANAVRDLKRQKRDLGRERSLDAALDQSSARLDAWKVAEEQSSPSERAERDEQLLRLAQALARLPDAQRQAVTLHHLHHWTLEDVAGHLGLTQAAVAGLIKRGLKQLRVQLQDRP
jgi:RNA polymerase sigma-70 factor (ECF subfamily)